MKQEKTIYCYPLSVSQSTALEKSNEEIITRSNSEGPDFAQTVILKNDGTNSCAFTSIRIIGNVLQVNIKSFVKELLMDLSVDSIINYPKSFNSFRDTARLYDTYGAYEILYSNYLLHNKFEFQEYLVENEASNLQCWFPTRNNERNR